MIEAIDQDNDICDHSLGQNYPEDDTARLLSYLEEKETSPDDMRAAESIKI
jgi:hypothetical protein